MHACTHIRALREGQIRREAGAQSPRVSYLVHLQDRFRVMGYSEHHENSNLCTFVLR